MAPKKWTYYLSKLTLLDEILGFIYWALASYGIFLIAGYIESQIAMICAFLIYIITVAFFYIFISKKVKKYINEDSN
ncbi:hypothetical protein [Rheinheimera sp. WS51]|uniref:hypothetical protein n=1 Tax=Rheinheimera sp. WS51 TaxID=3425886 RepID=UPI003D8C6C08